MAKVWVLAKLGYDEYTIIGIYTSEAFAQQERERIELAEVQTGGRPRLRNRRDDGFAIEEFELDVTGFDWVVRVRADGQVADVVTRAGYRSVNQNYEPKYEGVGKSFEDALQLALAARPEPRTDPPTPDWPNDRSDDDE